MIFDRGPQVAVRASHVFHQLDPSDGWTISPEGTGYVIGGAGEVTFDATDGVIYFDDFDGERRSIKLPSGVTTEIVASLLTALWWAHRRS